MLFSFYSNVSSGANRTFFASMSETTAALDAFPFDSVFATPVHHVFRSTPEPGATSSSNLRTCESS